MKKLTMFFAAIAMTVASASAQFSVVPEIGVNFSQLRTASDNHTSLSDPLAGFSIGAGLNIGGEEGIYVRPGLYYHNLNNYTFGGKYHMHYLQIPVAVGYVYNIGSAGDLFGEVAPYVGFGLAGNSKSVSLGNNTIKNKINWGSNLGETDRFDWGLKFAVGYKTPWGVFLKGGYNLGLGNLSNSDNTKLNHRGWNLSLGYHINL